jgi:hypothetical protein
MHIGKEGGKVNREDKGGKGEYWEVGEKINCGEE